MKKKTVALIRRLYSPKGQYFLSSWACTFTLVLFVVKAAIGTHSIESAKAQAAPMAEKGIVYAQEAPAKNGVPLAIWLAGGISILGALGSFYMAIRAIRARNEAQDSCRRAELYHNPPDLEAKVEEAARLNCCSMKWAQAAEKHAKDAESYAVPVADDVTDDEESDYETSRPHGNQDSYIYTTVSQNLAPYPGAQVDAEIRITEDADFVAKSMAVVGVDPSTGRALNDLDMNIEIEVRNLAQCRDSQNRAIPVQMFESATMIEKRISLNHRFPKARLFLRSSAIRIRLTNRSTARMNVYVSLLGYKVFDPALVPNSRGYIHNPYYHLRPESMDEVVKDEDYDDDEEASDEGVL